LCRRRLIFDDYRNVLHAGSEARRNATECLFHQLVEIRCPHAEAFAKKLLSLGDASLGSA
jgi:hypothetical protein